MNSLFSPRTLVFAAMLAAPAIWQLMAEDAISVDTLLWRYLVAVAACVAVNVIMDLAGSTVLSHESLADEDVSMASRTDATEPTTP